MGSLWILVKGFGIDPVPARVPALIVGSIVMFLGNKYFVFNQRSAQTLAREAIHFTIVQVVGIAVTYVVFKALLGLSPSFEPHYILVGLVANNFVWLAYFFPLWHFVFRSTEPKPAPKPTVVA